MKMKYKYRAKRHNGEWVYGSLVWTEHVEPAIYYEVGRGEYYTIHSCYVNPDTVGQFTGLHDKNGKEIYEGDIISVELSDNSVIYKLVKYIPERASYCTACTLELQYEGKWDIWGCISEEWVADLNATVAGNIHDNPELLEK